MAYSLFNKLRTNKQRSLTQLRIKSHPIVKIDQGSYARMDSLPSTPNSVNSVGNN